LLNGNLNGCFLAASHSIAIDGTGHVSQLTSVFGSQSAVVAYTVDSDPTPRQISVGGVGFSVSGITLGQDFSWPAPDCNVSAHSTSSTATHSVSMSLIGGSVSGITTSHGAASCPFQGLTVTLGASTINLNDVTTVTVSGMTQCELVGVSSNNTNVATVLSLGYNYFQAQSAGVGSTPIVAICGTQWGSATLTVKEPDPCDDPAADNYEQAGTCTYPPQTCQDETATNFDEVGTCIYPPPPSDQCEDATADNYQEVGDCVYSSPPDPGSGDGGGGGGGGWSPDDPCFYNPADPSCIEAEMSLVPRGGLGRNGIMASFVAPITGPGTSSSLGGSPYYVVLVGNWSDPSVMAMVGRFRHKNGFVDAIYLPASSPSATAWTLAVRALSLDRVTAGDPYATRRIIRIGNNGSQQLARNDGAPINLKRWTPISRSEVGNLESQFHAGIMKEIGHAPKHTSPRMGGLQLLKWPHK
jgi:hypothetical protein